MSEASIRSLQDSPPRELEQHASMSGSSNRLSLDYVFGERKGHGQHDDNSNATFTLRDCR